MGNDPVLVDVADGVCTVTLNRPEGDANARLAVGDALVNERTVFQSFSVDFAEVERRRAAVVERGRRQHD